MNASLREQAKQLAARPYTVKVVRDNSDPEEVLYLALNPELDGCMAQGMSIEEAEENLNEFRVDYIEHLLEHKLPVPYPASQATITGSLRGAVVRGLKTSDPEFEDVLMQVIQPSSRATLFEASSRT